MNESTTNSAMNEEAENKFEAGKAHVKQAADELRSAAEAKAAEMRSVAEAKAGEYRDKAEEAYQQARARARSLQDESEAYIRENPLRGVLTALGIGFVVGLFFRR